MYIRNGEPFDITAPHVFDDVQYPVGWFFDADNHAAFGIVELFDAAPPAISADQKLVQDGYAQDEQGRWVARWMVVDKSAAELAQDAVAAVALLEANRSALIARIDAEVDAIYAAVIGNRSDEYNAARDEATAFAAADYAGDAPASVQSWADAKGWAAQQAADDILAAAARLVALRDTIRAQRLAKKEAARLALDAAALDTVSGQWAAALAAIRSAAGL
jgi:hypothetical protein